jgi:hypothetical protein
VIEVPTESAGAPALAAGLRTVRRELLVTIEGLPESRIYRATEREGWTLKHELAYLAAADRVLLALIERLRELPPSLDVPLVLAHSPTALRRLHGEEMHATVELRLGPLRDELAALGERVPHAIEEHAPRLVHPVVFGDAPLPALTHVHAYLARWHEGYARVRGVVE